ncbi:MAG: polymer-forming cytoskeletal protein [Lachnospiraceae bacterium]|nr:polymer-forming cytoskeletal protein [Lachnospiraceae bacterium]
MGFFKEFKEDFSDAVDELIPGGESLPEEEVMVNTLDNDVDVNSELSKLDGLLEKASKKVEENNTIAPKVTSSSDFVKEAAKKEEPITHMKENKMDANDTMELERAAAAVNNVAVDTSAVSDENAVITSGMKITGDLESTGSIDVEGTINGNVKCNGKLTVTGMIKGNSVSSEFFADNAKIEGEVATSGTVKVGAGSVVVGNISATSAVIAGAVKGDIDVQGPVVVDTSAVVMGNIKSRSVQINNGAVIEGFCSQAYAEVDVASVFEQ